MPNVYSKIFNEIPPIDYNFYYASVPSTIFGLNMDFNDPKLEDQFRQESSI